MPGNTFPTFKDHSVMNNKFKSGGFTYAWTNESSKMFNVFPIESFNNKRPESVIAPYGRDIRGRKIKSLVQPYYEPVNKIEDCFDIQNISWEIEFIHVCNNRYLNGQHQTMVTSSGAAERNFRKENPNYIFL